MDFTVTFPSQKQLYRQKNKTWRQRCVDWAASRTYFNFAPVRNNIVNMKINYDLMNGVIHMEDVSGLLNPSKLASLFIPEKIQHYPIINSKINTLRGEEAARVFDWKVIVTNPNSVSELEENKKKEFDAMVAGVVQNGNIDQNQAEQQIQEGQNYINYSWQDMRELRANELLKHYSKEQDFKQTFNDGFVDACVSSNEIYECGISGGEPYLRRLNPMKLRAFRTGYSNRIEDADVLIYEDYWSPGAIVTEFYDELSEKDIKKLSDDLPDYGGSGPIGAAGNIDESREFISRRIIGEDGILVNGSDEFSGAFDTLAELDGGIGSTLLPYDVAGNIRVLRVWWKSLRKIYMVASYDPETGEKNYDFYPETYVPDKDAGEEATPLWVNEMWQGTKIGEDIYVGIRPCLVQHNSISNPSRCHCGIVGTIYNLNEARPYSLVDMMKPYSYMYDAIHAKLVDLIATNWGKILEMDLALKPKDWSVDKWMYFARANKVLVRDSFREGNKGAATGKLAGGLNNASKGYIDADWGNSIQNYIELLQWTKDSMSDLVGINRQREGNTYNRETVGGIERAVLQSSYITDWLFQKHDDTKKRALECFLEYAKAAIRGRSLKFQYILSDGTRRMMEIDGDEFCESDYGLVVDNSQDTQKLSSQIETLAQAALQNQLLDFSSILKLFTSVSTSEKIQIVDTAQRKADAARQQQALEAQRAEQEKLQAELQAKAQELEQKERLAQLDSDTRLKVAEINSRAEYLRLGIYENQNNEELRREELQIDKDKLRAEIEQFDKELRLKDKELDQKKEIELKKIEATKKKVVSKS
jgi:hypothetical protein